MKNGMQNFYENNFNDVEDLHALNFFKNN